MLQMPTRSTELLSHRKNENENENDMAQSRAPLITEKMPTRNESISQQVRKLYWKTDLFAFQV